MPTRATRLLLSLLLAVGALLAAPGTAQAHAGLTASSPADGSTVTEALPAVVLTFSSTVRGPEVAVTGPDGGTVSTSAVADGSTVTVPVAATTTGAHTVTWAVTSADGHDLTGTLGFTYAGPVPVAGPATSAPAPSTPAASTPAASTPAAAAEQPRTTEPTGSTAGTTGTVVVVALVAVVVLGLVTAGLRRRA